MTYQTTQYAYCHLEYLYLRIEVEVDIVYYKLDSFLEALFVSENDQAAQRVYESEGIPAHDIVHFVLAESVIACFRWR
jgi:hypothetical protein